MRPRTAGIVVLLLGIVLLAGCVTAPGTKQTPSPNETNSVKTATPISPVEMPDKEATERALSAEEAHLTSRLENASCLDNWGTTASTATSQATIIERTRNGVIVEVIHPYWYTKGASHADGAATARYRVSPNRTVRQEGTKVDPC